MFLSTRRPKANPERSTSEHSDKAGWSASWNDHLGTNRNTRYGAEALFSRQHVIRIRPPPRWALAWYGGAFFGPTSLLRQPSRARPAPPRARRTRVQHPSHGEQDTVASVRGPWTSRRENRTRSWRLGQASRSGSALPSGMHRKGPRYSILHVKERELPYTGMNPDDSGASTKSSGA